MTDEFDIVITVEAQPEQAKLLQQIADEWQVSLHGAAALMPAGAIYPVWMSRTYGG